MPPRLERAAIGGAGYDQYGQPLPEETLEICKRADAILFGAIGGPQYDGLARELRPEKGLLNLRSSLSLFSNLRPAILYPATGRRLQSETRSGCRPRYNDCARADRGHLLRRPAWNSRVEKTEAARVITPWSTPSMKLNASRVPRSKSRACAIVSLCSVDKANVLEVSELWREVVDRVATDYAEVSVSHMYVDNASMQLVRAPKQFDVIVTGNLFGDILSDTAAMLTGSIGMLPSASLDENGKGMYEPVHGSAPDIAGKNLANPLATILSLAMMLRYSLQQPQLADLVETAVGEVLDQGLRTADIAGAASRGGHTRDG